MSLPDLLHALGPEIEDYEEGKRGHRLEVSLLAKYFGANRALPSLLPVYSIPESWFR